MNRTNLNPWRMPLPTRTVTWNMEWLSRIPATTAQTVLVHLCHADLKIAIPTSVIRMAVTSLVGISVKLLLD